MGFIEKNDREAAEDMRKKYPVLAIPHGHYLGGYQTGSPAATTRRGKTFTLFDCPISVSTPMARMPPYPSGSTINQTLYKRWKNPTTREEDLTYGALLPAGYQPINGLWICPIESCSASGFESLRNLGCHFNRGHRGTKLHDNLDGTLSDVGMYVTEDQVRTGIPGFRLPSVIFSKADVPLDGDPAPSTAGDGIAVSLLALDLTGVGRNDEMISSGAAAAAANLQDYRDDPFDEGVIYPCRIRTCALICHSQRELDDHYRDNHGFSRGSESNDHNQNPLPEDILPVQPPHNFFSQSSREDIGKLGAWEALEGRKMASQAAEQSSPPALAYSGNYLSRSAHPVPITEQADVSSVTVSGIHTFAIQQHSDLVCIVMTGELLVQLDNEPHFTLTAHGVFRVQAGGKCSVLNTNMDDAVLHVIRVTRSL
ncbi:hypothetical protein QBC44DRAFT_310263 [Cladorrhinum sp. PSN332]|nr:hypothetical protein QBC44DRAFT_310263 [Cladorrhinum sp. PSN332]